MQDIFMYCSEKLSRGRSLLHWDLMMTDYTGEEISISEETVREMPEVDGAGILDVIIEATYNMLVCRDRRGSPSISQYFCCFYPQVR